MLLSVIVVVVVVAVVAAGVRTQAQQRGLSNGQSVQQGPRHGARADQLGVVAHVEGGGVGAPGVGLRGTDGHLWSVLASVEAAAAASASTAAAAACNEK